MHVVLVNVEEVIMEEIADPKMTRNGVALTYAFCLRQLPEHVSFREINRAIIARWTPSALEYIKRRAWKLYEDWAAKARG